MLSKRTSAESLSSPSAAWRTSLVLARGINDEKGGEIDWYTFELERRLVDGENVISTRPILRFHWITTSIERNNAVHFAGIYLAHCYCFFHGHNNVLVGLARTSSIRLVARVVGGNVDVSSYTIADPRTLVIRAGEPAHVVRALTRNAQRHLRNLKYFSNICKNAGN